MKKTYVPPSLMVIYAELDNMFCGSVNSTNNIDYGGVDEEGELNPSTCLFHLWVIGEDS